MQDAESQCTRLKKELGALRSYLLSTVTVEPILIYGRSRKDNSITLATAPLPFGPIVNTTKSVVSNDISRTDSAAGQNERLGNERHQHSEMNDEDVPDNEIAMNNLQQPFQPATPIVQADGTLLYFDKSPGSSSPPIHNNKRRCLPELTHPVPIAFPKLFHKSFQPSTDDPLPTQLQSPVQFQQRSRKITMGDAETEHLLLAAKRITRIKKIPPWSSADERPIWPALAPSEERGSFHGSQSSADHSLRPLDESLPTTELAAIPYLSLLESAAPTIPFSETRLPLDQVKRTHASPVPADNGQQLDCKSKKIGRPRGSPNKTKTISINETAASRRRMRAIEFATRHGGRGRGRGRPRFHQPKPPGPQPNGASDIGDLLWIAQMEVDTEDKDQMSEMVDGSISATVEEEQPEEMKDDNNSYKDDDEYEYEDEHESEYENGIEHQGESHDKDQSYDEINPPPPRSRFTEHSECSQTPGTLSDHKDRFQQCNPPKTPCTIERQQSALDVLADQAASASTGPPQAGQSDPHIYQGRDLASEMARPKHGYTGYAIPLIPNAGQYQYSNATPMQAQMEHKTVLGDPFQYDFDKRGINAYAVNNTATSFHHLNNQHLSNDLQQPQQQSYSGNYSPLSYPSEAFHADGFTPTSDPLSGRGRPVQLTIAQQLSAMVHVSHPLIDQSDINAGMTPAAALAKKSRSPYVKWSTQEDELLVKCVAKHGTRWDAVSKCLPNRSYHQCRQRWLRGLKCEFLRYFCAPL